MSQLTLQQLRDHGISPDTGLGQHFLVDDNILRVIETMSQITPEDVVYEPGPGVGVLTAFLADKVKAVHAVEIDRRLEPALNIVTERHSNVHVLWDDALHIRPGDLDPAPTALVSNLPYHVAAPIVVESLQHAPDIGRYCVMVQREVADRFFAPVGGANYGGISVVIQTLCDRTRAHNVSRSVFIPQPNVDSTLVAFTRRSDSPLAPEDVPAYAALVKGAFAHRRKTLSNNLQRHGWDKERIAAAIEATGLKPSARPQELSPAQFVTVFEAR